ncbi:hypothetical protein M9H77_01648 [Catharanthus roseus]|uniref:Uncharacterized protein n=1 Tax=Catharanthus roseus TaxID=4058 RepID=A0ACC0C682_CATRO|nr:hypothetical protein M9H77_01648 [Catharanthus roseus]
MATSENWYLFVHNGRHNHKLAVYNHGAVAIDSAVQKSYVSPRNILRFFLEQDVGCALSAQKIYNVVAKIKQGRNTIEEVFCLNAKRGYTVFHGNREESNYNMPLLEVVGMALIGKNFKVAIAFISNEQATTYR